MKHFHSIIRIWNSSTGIQEQRDGVDIREEQEIAEIVGQQGRVTSVITTTGQHIPCELVLLGIGIEPNTDFVKAAGIACGRGVKVDAGMRTNVPDVYAAGDLVETTDPITGKARVIGQWYPSIQQARAAAYSMLDVLDTQRVFNFGNFYNACKLYGLDFASVGISVCPKGGKGYQELVADPQPRQYQKVILKDGVPVGMIALGDRRTVLAYKRAIDHKVNLAPVAARLFDPDFRLQEWLDKQGVPPGRLAVSREGAEEIQKLAYAGMQAVQTTGAAKVAETTAPGGSPVPASIANMLEEARLKPLQPPEAVATLKETYLSQTKVTTIGRMEGATLTIRHQSVSRRHAEISFANGRYVLRDLGSKNSTWLNGQQVAPNSLSLLKADDHVAFGSVLFAFQVRQVEQSASVLLSKKHLSGPREGKVLTVPGVASLTCRQCGETLSVGVRFCPRCGTAALQAQGRE